MGRGAWWWASACVALACLCGTTQSRIVSLEDFGAVPDEPESNLTNTKAFNDAISAAEPGDTILIPGGKTFYLIGGVVGANLTNVSIAFEGDIRAVPDLDLWPQTDDDGYVDLIALTSCKDLHITGPGTIDGQGKTWWNQCLIGKISYGSRPSLLSVYYSSDVSVIGLDLVNGPRFHLWLQQNERVEVGFVNVTVDREEVRAVKRAMQEQMRAEAEAEAESESESKLEFAGAPGDLPRLQPADLNTDGIDPSGRDYWIHDCIIANDDDSIAVKPNKWSDVVGAEGSAPGCSENMLIENTVLHGFGASIGSVAPKPIEEDGSFFKSCVRNITFRNISMPRSGKGIYVKSNPYCDGDERRALLSDLTFEDMVITKPEWWAIWIGPQQQHEPSSDLGERCSLVYPIRDQCPTQGCADFRNITLRNIQIVDPWLSPGVILGNVTNPMSGILFDNVTVTKSGHLPLLPYGDAYHCENAQIEAINSDPGLDCSVGLPS